MKGTEVIVVFSPLGDLFGFLYSIVGNRSIKSACMVFKKL